MGCDINAWNIQYCSYKTMQSIQASSIKALIAVKMLTKWNQSHTMAKINKHYYQNKDRIICNTKLRCLWIIGKSDVVPQSESEAYDQEV